MELSSNFEIIENNELEILYGGNAFTQFVLDSAACIGLSAGTVKLFVVSPWAMLGCGLFAGGVYLQQCYNNAKANGLI